MWYYIRKHWKINSLITVLQVARAGISVYINFLMIEAGERLLALDLKGILLLTVWVLLLYYTLSGLDIARTWAMSRSTMEMNNHVRADITATILDKSHLEYHAQQSGEYLSWYLNDVNRIVSYGWESYFSILVLFSEVVFSITALTSLHWSLVIISVLVSLVMIFFPKLFEKRIARLSTTCAAEQAAATSKLKEMLAGLDVLRFFGKVNRFVMGNHAASEQMEQPRHKQAVQQSVMEETISIVDTTCQNVVAGVIYTYSILGILPLASIFGAGNLCGTLYSRLSTLSKRRLSIQAAKPYFDKITVHAEEISDVQKPSIAPISDGIDVENLSFSYGDKPILENASFHFEKGGKYALVGPSGCGKSTLLKLILGWLPDYTGTITFDGQDIRSYTPDQLQQQMSYIEQDVFLFNTTILDNITLGGSYTQEELEKAIRGSALADDLENMPLGLDTPVGEDGSSLSGGQKQRVAIARALIHNRSILLVDEGTSALDQKNADAVEQSLLSNPDLTLILVSHHLSDERKAQFTQVYTLETLPAAV